MKLTALIAAIALLTGCGGIIVGGKCYKWDVEPDSVCYSSAPPAAHEAKS